jgi:hypothetical protein
MHKSQGLFYLTTALHVAGVTITHLQEHKTNITTATGNRYTVIDRVKSTDKLLSDKINSVTCASSWNYIFENSKIFFVK